MNADLASKKYYEGKKKANYNSKFKLNNIEENPDIFNKAILQDQIQLANLGNKTTEEALIKI
jgi:hypothetical protein